MNIDLGYQNVVVVFDLDDTLFYEKDYVISAYRAIDRYMVDKHSIAQDFCYQTMIVAFEKKQNPFDALFHALSGTYPEVNEDIATLLDIYRYHAPSISLSPQTSEFLQQLQSMKIRMGLVTDGRSKTQRNKIDALGIAKYFDAQDIIISEEIGKDKSSPDAFSHFVHRFPNAKGFIYVGDNPAKDFLWPNLLGWKSICLKDKGDNIHPQTEQDDKDSMPSIVVDNLSDVLTHL